MFGNGAATGMRSTPTPAAPGRRRRRQSGRARQKFRSAPAAGTAASAAGRFVPVQRQLLRQLSAECPDGQLARHRHVARRLSLRRAWAAGGRNRSRLDRSRLDETQPAPAKRSVCCRAASEPGESPAKESPMKHRFCQLLIALAAIAILFACRFERLPATRPILCPLGTRGRQAGDSRFRPRRRPTRRAPNSSRPSERIATFDQDGTLWVEHPMYTQIVFCLERVPALVKEKPELKNVEPFKTVLSGDKEAIAKLSIDDLVKILVATLLGHDGRRVRSRGQKVAGHGPASALESALHRTDLPADARSAAASSARRATRRTSSPAAGRISCASMPKRSTAFRPSRSWERMAATTFGYAKDGRPDADQRS